MKKQRARAIAVIAIAAVIAACGGASDDPEAAQPPGESEQEQTGAASEADSLPTESDGVTESGATAVPDGFPPEMPLPQGAQYSFNAFDVEYFYVERPVADVIDELEGLLPAHDWQVIEVVNGVAWVDDQMFEVEGHGLRMFVYAEPSAGSETETSLSIGLRE